MTTPALVDLQYLFYGGGVDAQYAFLSAANAQGITAVDLLKRAGGVISSQPGAAVTNQSTLTTLLSGAVTAPSVPVVGETWDIDMYGQLLNNTAASRNITFTVGYGGALVTTATSGTLAQSASYRPWGARLVLVFTTIDATSGKFDLKIDTWFGGTTATPTGSLSGIATSIVGGDTSSVGNTATASALSFGCTPNQADFSITPSRIIVRRRLP